MEQWNFHKCSLGPHFSVSNHDKRCQIVGWEPTTAACWKLMFLTEPQTQNLHLMLLRMAVGVKWVNMCTITISYENDIYGINDSSGLNFIIDGKYVGKVYRHSCIWKSSVWCSDVFYLELGIFKTCLSINGCVLWLEKWDFQSGISVRI